MTDQTKKDVSLAIETTCSQGGLALGVGEDILARTDFDASARHTSQLVVKMDEILRGAGFDPYALDHVYVSAGPGSFTGTRLGVTAAKILGQFVPNLKCVAVPTAAVVAVAAPAVAGNIAVIMDAREKCVYAAQFHRAGENIVPADEPFVGPAEEFLARCKRPVMFTGEGLKYYPQLTVPAEGVEIAPENLWLPTVDNTWRLGRQLACRGEFTDYRRLLPVYARQPKAARDVRR